MSSPRLRITASGTKYFQEPGAVLIARTQTDLLPVHSFLAQRDSSFEHYLFDGPRPDDGTLLAKFAGQLCYLSFGENRTKHADAAKYIDHIKASGHGSVLEHANYSFLLYGIDRAVTHELVRHRAGMAYSQVSQRYVGPEQLVFVEPFEMQNDERLHRHFEQLADEAKAKYEEMIEAFANRLASIEGESNRDKRKRMHSFARRVLPNMTEAPIVATGNVRAWRHVFTMRLAQPADAAIRRAMWPAFETMLRECPPCFDDFEQHKLPDGTMAATPRYTKV